MRYRQWAILAGAVVLTADPNPGAAQSASATAPPTSGILQARAALRYDPAKRCPELQRAGADDEGVAVTVFRVGATGAPSQVSVKSSSGSESLDAAAVSCVQKLRFQPAIRDGDGVAVDSWQQMSWKSVGPPPEEHCGPSATVAKSDSSAPASGHVPNEGRVGVCVCVDGTGKLTQEPTILQSSGDASFDEAALKLVSSGHYKSAVQDGKAKPGCVRYRVKFSVD
jgi:TonB family protein